LKKAKVGPLPGVTQHISGFKVHTDLHHVIASSMSIWVKGNLVLIRILWDAEQIGEKPSVYVLDTPGVLVPNIDNIDTGLKLALTGENLFLLMVFVKRGFKALQL